MPVFTYRPRYQYNGPTLSHPLLEELSESEVDRNFRLLVDDLEAHFREIGGTVEEIQGGIVCVSVDLTQSECDDIVAGYLRNLYLVADRVLAE